MPASWDPSYETFVVTVGGRRASILVDLAAREYVPLVSHPLRLAIRAPLAKPRANGLPTAEEYWALCDVEDRISAALVERCDAIFVGHMSHDGAMTSFFHAPSEARACIDDTLAALNVDAAAWLIEEDATWALYHEALYPDAHSLRSILNRQRLETFAEAGDDLEAARAVDHRLYFSSIVNANAARPVLIEAGFAVAEAEAPDEEGRVALVVTRSDTLAGGRLDALCDELDALIAPFGGEYGTWRALHVLSSPSG